MRAVTLTSAWPSRADTAGGGTPLEIRCVACVCRSVCMLPSLIPALCIRRTSAPNARSPPSDHLVVVRKGRRVHLDRDDLDRRIEANKFSDGWHQQSTPLVTTNAWR